MEVTAKQKFTTKDMVETSLLIALVFIATKFINIRLPISINGGLVHLGTAMLFISAIVFGSKKGALSGAIGMSLFDLISGWTLWAPFTFIVRGVMGYLLGKIAWVNGNNGNNFLINVIGICVSSIWMLFGYYITEVILYGNFIVPLTSIPGNLMQVLIGLIIALPISKVLKKCIK
ncbi:ECF transporter S component [Clostridioides difficile]|uniref:ECF transporter S component n=1 Tax=Clostridioides difficile TaxID=1496 RepID=UPI000C99C48F|nr:ECF transporter S component [Clostridioides difficile]MBF9868936.1 ECF transporter S component [Clostridioides difficile]MBY1214805.1 ECF transporter S component [Clostridioides difficile]MBZ1029287.1 ECF transporter S component [Clostridioides difficile]MCA0852085.1 ECF transporter S component [Clostridioides difficile]MCA0874929.1 ECF transporter S component [Clostridioides difficile]